MKFIFVSYLILEFVEKTKIVLPKTPTNRRLEKKASVMGTHLQSVCVWGRAGGGMAGEGG